MDYKYKVIKKMSDFIEKPKEIIPKFLIVGERRSNELVKLFLNSASLLSNKFDFEIIFINGNADLEPEYIPFLLNIKFMILSEPTEFKSESAKNLVKVDFLNQKTDMFKELSSFPVNPDTDIIELTKKLSTFLMLFGKDIDFDITALKNASASQNKTEVKVSAIVSTYNSEIFIEGCLQDLVEQSLYQKGLLEIIVVDSCSEQNEKKIVEEFQAKYPNISYMRTKNREGIYKAWNRGIKIARGKYLTNANTDDRHRTDALEIMADTLDKNKNADLVYGDIYITKTPNQTFENATIVSKVTRPEFASDIMLTGCHMGPQPMWRKELHDESGWFNEAYKSAGDYEFWCRLALIGKKKFLHIKDFLGLYLWNKEGIELSNINLSTKETTTIKELYSKIEYKNKLVSTGESPKDIIFLTYNRLDYFIKTIDTLILNTRYPYNIIIVDNNSDEDFKNYIKQTSLLYSQAIFNKTNEWTKAFQKGIELSVSDPFIVSDPDILVPAFKNKCWLERCVDLHKQIPDLGLLALNLDPSNKPQKLPDVYLGDKKAYNDELVLSNVGTVMQSIKRKYFDFSYVTDWETCERIRVNGGLVGFAKNIVAYHLGWDEESDYPDYIVDKYKYYKENYGVDTYKMYTTNKKLLSNMKKSVENNYYGYPRPEVQALVNPDSKKILDVGCGAGVMAIQLKEKFNAEVWGIEYVPEVAKIAAEKIDKVLAGSVEDKLDELPEKYFDTIIFADVLEHLEYPDEILNKIKSKLKPGGEVIASIPNIRHWSTLLDLIQGNWNYTDAGILDKTHLKFFTRNSIIKLFQDSGYKIKELQATYLNPADEIKSIWDSVIRALGSTNLDISTLADEGTHYQYLIKVKSTSLNTIVPLFNNLEYTEKFISSLQGSVAEVNDIILIDNFSSDETPKYISELEKTNSNILAIKNSKNLGFPKAVNQGLNRISGEYILIANNDIIIPPGAIERMIEVAELNPSIGIVGPVSNSVSGAQFDENAKYKSIDEMYEYAEMLKNKKAGQVAQFPRVAFLCTLIKKEVIEKIGGLDERFSPGNYEDDDFCLRAQMAGFKTVIALDVFIHHFGSKSFKADGEKKYAERLEINKAKFVEKWGASPDEIWLKGKQPNKLNPFYPINSNKVIESVQRVQISIENNDYYTAFEHLNEVLNNPDSKNSLSELEYAKINELYSKISKFIN